MISEKINKLGTSDCSLHACFTLKNEKLSAAPEAEQCGWCKDKYGLSWQIVPENIEELMKIPNAFAIMMNQKKIAISEYKNKH